jgi:hypothetical protein
MPEYRKVICNVLCAPNIRSGSFLIQELSGYDTVTVAHLGRWATGAGEPPETYSVLKLFAGLANPAFMAWKLMVNKAIAMAPTAVMANTHQLSAMR